MKVHILYKFLDGPYGGANQFLNGLKIALKREEMYSTELAEADVVLINLSPDNFAKSIKDIFNLAFILPKKTIVARIDGPIGLIRNSGKEYDKAFMLFCKYFSDGIIYQSEWSKKKLLGLNIIPEIRETVILNGSDSDIFNNRDRVLFNPSRKLRIIASSWSTNMNKGFNSYKWLDDNLDFNRYEMIFVGNSPIDFKNIKRMPPITSKELAKLLKRSDVYITASQNDTCSNSLIEAISCGVIPISLNCGGHPELNQLKVLGFENVNEVPEILQYVEDNYQKLYGTISLDSLEEVFKKYKKFLLEDRVTDKHKSSMKYLIFLKICLLVSVKKSFDVLVYKLGSLFV